MITSLYPSDGPAAGRTPVVVHGNFKSSASSFNTAVYCVFGAVYTVGNFIKNTDSIMCVSPKYTVADAKSTTVTFYITYDSSNTTGYNNTSAANFTYHPSPGVESLMPNRGSLHGGTPIVIEGSNFVDTPTLSCVFTASVVVITPAIYRNSTSIKCV
jgi:hypothetical protein